jgi:hypothetical protein
MVAGITNSRANDRASAKPARPDLDDVVRALAHISEEVSVAELGEPSQKLPHEWRWGSHGSLAVCMAGAKQGLWVSYETGVGGNQLHLIAYCRGISFCEAIPIGLEYLGGALPHAAPSKHRIGGLKSGAVDRADNAIEANTASALRTWRETVPILGTLGEVYLAVVRGLDVARLDVRHALRWHARAQAIIGLMTHAVTGEATGIHRTFLNPDGSKRERKMLGRQGVIRLSPDAAVTNSVGLAEGIEDALAVLLSGWSPMWAATSAGAIARFPVLSGVDVLTIFADPDDAGLRAAEACRDQWGEAGREAAIVLPGGRSS